MSGRTIKARLARDGGERRRALRQSVEIDGTVRELGEEGVEARVLDISEIGFMASSDAHFAVGARVWLILPGRERASAEVIWIDGDRLGAEFAEPISLDGLDL
jgi:hypothetical protein